MRALLLAVLLVAPLTTPARAQEPVAEDSLPEPSTAEAASWDMALSAYLYFVPDDVEYLQPTFSVDHARLHLEARYNYEDLKTASAWVGVNLDAGEDVAFAFTPIVGGVVGRSNAVGIGYRTSLDWRWLAIYGEAELVLDVEAIEESFFYVWSELTVSPVDWLTVGAVAQRTRTYPTERSSSSGNTSVFMAT